MIVFLQKTRSCRVNRRYSISIDEKIASSVANQIATVATTVTARASLSRQYQIHHGENKSITTKTKSQRQ